MIYYYLKALHIIFIVTWFAGLFYLPRLLVYLREAKEQNEPARSILTQQLIVMARRLLYAITWPSAVLTLILGCSLLFMHPELLRQGFMHAKLGLVVLLYGYHFSLQYLLNALIRGETKYTSARLRMWNEVPTVILFGIVFLIIVRNSLDAVWGLAALALLMASIFTGIVVYRKIRKRNDQKVL